MKKSLIILLCLINYVNISAQQLTAEDITNYAGSILEKSDINNYEFENSNWNFDLDREVYDYSIKEISFEYNLSDRFLLKRVKIKINSDKEYNFSLHYIIKSSYRYRNSKKDIVNLYLDAKNKSPERFEIFDDYITIKRTNKTNEYTRIKFDDNNQIISFENRNIEDQILEENYKYIKDKIRESKKIISKIKSEIFKDNTEFNLEVVLNDHKKIKNLFNDINWGNEKQKNKFFDRDNILNSHINKLGEIESSISNKIQDKANSLSKTNNIDEAEKFYGASMQVLYFIRYSDPKETQSIIEIGQKELSNLAQTNKNYTLQEPLRSIIRERIEQDLNDNIIKLKNSDITYNILIDENGNNKSNCDGCSFKSKIENTLLNKDGTKFQDKIKNTQLHKKYQDNLKFKVKYEEDRFTRSDGDIIGDGYYNVKSVTLTIDGSGLSYKDNYEEVYGYGGKGAIYALYGIIPGLGLSIYEEGDCWYYEGLYSSYHNWRTWLVYPAYGLSILFHSISNNQYEKYQSATNQVDIDKHIGIANTTGTIANYSLGIALTLHISEITEVLFKGISVDRKRNYGGSFFPKSFKEISF
tara:strand:+ start:27 stop:1775 length:1749 start_codon:yes stop_codon:yes gene_type:complete